MVWIIWRNYLWFVQQVVLMEGRDSHTHPKPRQETTISAATFGGAPFMPVTNTHLLERQQWRQQWRLRAETPQSWVITGRSGNIKEVRISKKSKLRPIKPLIPFFDHSQPLYLKIFISDSKTDEQTLILLQSGNQQIQFPRLTLGRFSEQGTPSLIRDISEEGFAQGHFRIGLTLRHHLHNRLWGNRACVTPGAAHRRVGFACERDHGKHMGPADIRTGSDVSWKHKELATCRFLLPTSTRGSWAGSVTRAMHYTS